MHDIEQIERELQETVEAMSADAREAWEEIEGLAEQGNASPDAAMGVVDRLYPSARDEVRRALGIKVKLLRAQSEAAAGEETLMEQLKAAMQKAKELEPDLPEEGLTVKKALAVLERHGVKHGISPEVLEIEVKVPARPEERGNREE